MALVSMFNDEPEQLSPQQEAHYEAVYRTRRAQDPRRRYWAFLRPPEKTRAEQDRRGHAPDGRYRKFPGASAAPSPPPDPEGAPGSTPEPDQQAPALRTPAPSVERRLSLEAMARTLTGKGKRR